MQTVGEVCVDERSIHTAVLRVECQHLSQVTQTDILQVTVVIGLYINIGHHPKCPWQGGTNQVSFS